MDVTSVFFAFLIYWKHKLLYSKSLMLTYIMPTSFQSMAEGYCFNICF